MLQTLPPKLDEGCLIIDSSTSKWKPQSCENPNIKHHMLCEPLETKLKEFNQSLQTSTHAPTTLSTSVNSSNGEPNVARRYADLYQEYFDY